MTFQTHNETRVSIDGTSLQGEIITTYARLITAFGNPMPGDGHKTDAEWAIQFDDGVIAAIYNWKNGVNYLGEEGKHVHQITHWNIGGHNHHAVSRVSEVIAEVDQDIDDMLRRIGVRQWVS